MSMPIAARKANNLARFKAGKKTKAAYEKECRAINFPSSYGAAKSNPRRKTAKRKNPVGDASFHKVYNAASKADDALSAELRKTFGKRAGDVRYQVKPAEGSKLHRLFDAKHKADAALRTWFEK